jgi:diguanylate cyclase (GGDEF)-like protein
VSNPEDNAYDDQLARILLENYNFLNEKGITGYIDYLKRENLNLRSIIEAGKEISSQSGIIRIVEQVAGVLNKRFIPGSLAFILESEHNAEQPDILYYENMAPKPAPFEITSLEPYRFFFNLSPQVISFPVFNYMMGKADLTEPFLKMKPSIVVPIMGFNQVYGFILIGEKLVGGEYTRSEHEYIESVMQFASIGLQNNIHYLKAVTDSKTKLYNHAYITTRLDLELARVKRYGFEIAVIMTDVDHFKHFNDTYGHLAGDKVLMRIAEIFLETIRKGDIAGRFGGEEFVLVLAQCTKENAKIVANRIRQRVEALSIMEDGHELKVTISLGVRYVNQASWADVESIIGQADKALYKSKESGRNKVFIWDPTRRKELPVLPQTE